MYSEESKILCEILLRESFGEDVSGSVKGLLDYGKLPLSKIYSLAHKRISKKVIQVSLSFLIQRGIIHQNIHYEYELNIKGILLFLRYPKYVVTVKNALGDQGERLFLEILKNGRISASKALLNTLFELNREDETNFRDVSGLTPTFQSLLSGKYIKRTSTSVLTGENDSEEVIEKKKFAYPSSINTSVINLRFKEGKKDHSFPDDEITWEVNYDRFHLLFRDKVLVEAATRRIDSTAGVLFESFLNKVTQDRNPWVEVTTALSYYDLVAQIPEKAFSLKSNLSQYLSLLTEDRSRFVDKVGDDAGGRYSCNLKKLFLKIALSVFDNVVLEKFGSKALRIFRTITQQKYVEESKLQSLVMIPAKETKLLTYQLLEGDFICLKELRKSVNNAVSKVFYLFYVDPVKLGRHLREYCYKTLSNSIIRRTHESSIHNRLMYKNKKIEDIIETLKNSEGPKEEIDEQINEVREMLSPEERETVFKVKNLLNKLRLATGQVEDTLFILDIFLVYNPRT